MTEQSIFSIESGLVQHLSDNDLKGLTKEWGVSEWLYVDAAWVYKMGKTDENGLAFEAATSVLNAGVENDNAFAKYCTVLEFHDLSRLIDFCSVLMREDN